jgi:predicted short-subunit dehydrogenase-like oxidoreductase (DUF2520 family)
MTFTIVGTGNMAWFITGRMIAAGHVCACVYGRDITKAQALAKHANTSNSYLIANGVNATADCCIIAVTDNAVNEVNPYLNTNTTIIYTAGALDIHNFSQHTDKAVLWPIYSIVKDNLPSHRAIPCAWEASTAKAKDIALTVANAVTDILTEADSTQRTALHLAAVFSNNFSNHLFAIAEQWCKEQNLQFELLRPIINQTVERLQTTSPHSLQTGPAKRGDDITIDKHIDLLAQHTDWQNVYKALTESIKEMYNK